MDKRTLSVRQEQVMEALWMHPEGQTASEIVHSNDELQMNTVQASLRALLKKNYIDVGKIVYSGTVLSRSYIPLISKEKYLGMRCQNLVEMASPLEILKDMINKIDDISELESLERTIKGRKKEV